MCVETKQWPHHCLLKPNSTAIRAAAIREPMPDWVKEYATSSQQYASVKAIITNESDRYWQKCNVKIQVLKSQQYFKIKSVVYKKPPKGCVIAGSFFFFKLDLYCYVNLSSKIVQSKLHSKLYLSSMWSSSDSHLYECFLFVCFFLHLGSAWQNLCGFTNLDATNYIS